MKLSVLITTYNLEQYIDQTIESVLGQTTDFDFEILIGDDGSTDATVQHICAWKDKYPDKIKYFVMERQPNQIYNRIERASKNRINLIEHADGEYLIFLDGDDVYTDTMKLQKQITVLEAPENQDCIACAHDIYLYWSEEKKERINNYTKSFKVSPKKYWRDGMYFHSDTVMFRNIFKKKFPKEIRKEYYDDNIIVFYLLKYGKIKYIPDVMVNYRQIEGSSWNSVSEFDKNIINLIDMGIEEQMNAALCRESRMRHMYNIFFVWRNKKKIPSEIRTKYLPQAQNAELKECVNWLCYEEVDFITRCRMNLKFFKDMFCFIFVKAGKIMRRNEYR